MKILVFDCEIKNGFQTGPGYRDFKTEDFKNMGISVACAYDYSSQDYLVFLEDNMPSLVTSLNGADLIVGFNIEKFDIPLIESCCGVMITAKTYDMLVYSRRSCGWREGAYYPKGLNLNEHLKGIWGDHTLKTENAADAPAMYQQRQMGRLISYCLADVKREKMLFDYMRETRTVTTPTHGKKMVEVPDLLTGVIG